MYRPDDIEQQRKYLDKVTQQPWFKWDMAWNGIRVRPKQATDAQIVTANEAIVRKLDDQYVCPRCEYYAYGHWDRDYKGPPRAKCPVCGWEGVAVTYKQYLGDKLYR